MKFKSLRHRILLISTSMIQAFCGIFLIHNSIIFGQSNLGIPPTLNFPKSTHHGGTQTWDISKDSRGVIYFANNDGLLEFNGTTWAKYTVPNKTIIRSCYVDNQSHRVYVGAQNEFGYFSPDRKGRLTYTSLVDLLHQKDRNFEDLWQILKWKDKLYFRTSKAIFILENQKVTIANCPKGSVFMGLGHNQVIVQASDLKLLSLQGNQFYEYHTGSVMLKSPLSGIIQWQGDTVLLATLKHGLYYLTETNFEKWTTPYDQILSQKRIYTCKLLSGQRLALGTSLDGCIILNQSRQSLYHFNKKNGIQNNNVLSVMEDNTHNLWLGLDNGLDCILLASPFTNIIPDRELQSTGYSATVFQNQIFFGQSDGAYTIPKKQFYDPFKNDKFDKLSCSEGQVWSFAKMDDRLLMGHHEGGFDINKSNCISLGNEIGVWTFLHLRDNYYLVGSYKGVNVFELHNKKWVYKGHIANLEESSRIMVRGLNRDVWISHPYRGIFRLKWNNNDILHPEVQYFDQKSGLPSTLNNGVFSIRNRPVFGTIKGIYVFDEAHSKFVPDPKFNDQIGKVGRIKCLKEDASGNIWYVAEDEIGLLKIQDVGLDKKIDKYIFNELKQKLVGGFEFIYPYENEEVIFGAEHGFIHFNPANVKYKSNVNVFISKITSGDSLLMGGWYLMAADDSLDLPLKLNYDHNSIAFHLGTSNFGDLANIKFRTRLLGLSDEWTPWNEEYKIGFTNLLAQRYTLEYQAMNAYGKMSPVGSITFSIKPPWYKSTLALFFYVLLILALLYGFIQRQQKKFEDEKARLVEIHEVEQEETMQQVEDTKAALEQIQTEKLEDEIEFKNKELALATMHLVQKGELLQSIKSTLQIMIDKSANAEARKELQSLANLLSFDEKLDEDWAQFAYHFDKVHVNFLNRLRSRYPQLTPNDEKLCAYLRMNLNIKETAQMLNISVRGVEASRYRLRKKLNLPNEANLAEFMMGI